MNMKDQTKALSSYIESMENSRVLIQDAVNDLFSVINHKNADIRGDVYDQIWRIASLIQSETGIKLPGNE